MVSIRKRFTQLPLGLFGLAAIICGLFWLVKAGAILITGNQPPIVFEAGQLFLLLGISGIGGTLRFENRLRRFGIRLVYLGIVSSVLLLVYTLLSPVAISNSDELDFPSLLQIISGLTLILGPMFLGWCALRSETFLGSWRILPLVLGVSLPLAIIVGTVLATFSAKERLLELPLMIYAFGWIALGWQMFRVSK